jgi:hypothetical protein
MPDPLMKQAKRDVKLAHRPERLAIRRSRRALKGDFKEAEARVAQVTQAMLGQLAQIPGAYQGQTSGIIGDITSGIGALGTQLGTNTIGAVPESERVAGIGNIQAIGSGAIEQVAGQQQNMADYLASGAQQGAVQGAVTARNYAKDYSRGLKENRQAMQDMTSGMHSEILQRLDQLKKERFDRSMVLKQLGMQQAEIDAHNREIDAAIWLAQKEAKDALRADKHRDRIRERERQRAAEDAADEEAGYTTPGPAWNPPSDTSLGGQNTGALGSQVAPQTQLAANASPQMVLQWLQTQPTQTQPGRIATASQIIAWINHTFGGAMFSPQVMGDGTIQVNNWSAQPMPPEMQQVVDAYNATIGGA